MEKRIGTVIIEIENRENAPYVNQIISKHSDIILGRQGLPQLTRDKAMHNTRIRLTNFFIKTLQCFVYIKPLH